MKISKEKACELLEIKDIIELGKQADEIRKGLHPDNEPVTFVVDRNINYTNVCTCRCNFCAFSKDIGQKGTYVLDYETIKKKIDELISVNGTQLLLQGGLNPEIPLDYYLELVTNLRNDYKNLTIHAFSPAEINYIAKNNNLSEKQLLEMLVECGLSSIPGGGAEILCDEIRAKISPNKISSQKWLDIMETAHNIGLKTTATMVFGFGENHGHVVEHLCKIRDLQERTGGFTAFIPWSFAPFKNYDKNLQNYDNTAHDYLKILAVSRIFLDNIPNIQASWVTQGLGVAQLSLRFGANDFGGTMLEENVVKAAGVSNKTNAEEIINHIKKAGFLPAQRNTSYKILKIF